MFDNIGGKLKGIAKAFCWIGIIGSIILAIVYFSISNGNGDLITSGIIILIVGCLVSWVGSLATYGFGELIDRIISIDKKLEKKGARLRDIASIGSSSGNDRSSKQTLMDDDGKLCELCGMRTDRLIPISITNRKGTRKARVCEECARLNKNVHRLDSTPKVKEQKVVEESQPESVKKEKPREFLLKETENGRNARLDAVHRRREDGPPIQEDLFLEDISKEKSVKKIYVLWSSYEFGDIYPEIDTALNDLKEKEKAEGASSTKTEQLKEELRAALTGEEIGTIQ